MKMSFDHQPRFRRFSTVQTNGSVEIIYETILDNLQPTIEEILRKSEMT